MTYYRNDPAALVRAWFAGLCVGATLAMLVIGAWLLIEP